MTIAKANLISRPDHLVKVRVRPGQVLRRENCSLTNGQMLRVTPGEARYLERHGIVDVIE
ncbi:MAG TPA: hypothetical protein VFN18_01265 [Solirubrobacterales bacterium]|nr:hypothetical protein [Solirubrobacterales bacterium]